MHYGMLHCDTDTQTVIYKSLDINLIHGDSYDRLCKNIQLNTVDNPLFNNNRHYGMKDVFGFFFTLHDVFFIMMHMCLKAVHT